MYSHLLSRLANIVLRGLTLACRLLLILLLARFLPASDVGLFGLFFISVNFGLTLAGLNFHSYSNREAIGADGHGKSQLLFNQLVLYLLAYLLMLPLAVATFQAGLLPWTLFGMFLALVVIEHLSYEAYRLFVALGRPITAGVVGFFRGASWVLLIVPVFLWREDLQTLTAVLVLWLLGGLVSLLYSLAVLHRDGFTFSNGSLDTAWIVRGLRVAAPFFLGTLAIRGIFTVDRYLVEALSDLAVVGVYTFYTGICVALLALIDAAIFSFSYPKLIHSANSGNEVEFKVRFRRLCVHCVTATLGLAAIIYVLSTPIIRLANNPIYLEYLDLFGLLLIAYCLFIIGSIPHYGLYAIKADGAILQARVVALVCFLASMALFYHFKPELFAVPTSMIIAFCCLSVLKSLLLAHHSGRFFSPQTQLVGD
ncbi:MAG: oligosaccharide flippase family protein [Pseudomonadales bacterium]|nr:oligosaccharide flippase family protein [Pseudomonadales bacterium]MCP5165817.1 oligosaccharide flippase family protein [Pseudomonadales bacterium]